MNSDINSYASVLTDTQQINIQNLKHAVSKDFVTKEEVVDYLIVMSEDYLKLLNNFNLMYAQLMDAVQPVSNFSFEEDMAKRLNTQVIKSDVLEDI